MSKKWQIPAHMGAVASITVIRLNSCLCASSALQVNAWRENVFDDFYFRVSVMLRAEATAEAAVAVVQNCSFAKKK